MYKHTGCRENVKYLEKYILDQNLKTMRTIFLKKLFNGVKQTISLLLTGCMGDNLEISYENFDFAT